MVMENAPMGMGTPTGTGDQMAVPEEVIEEGMEPVEPQSLFPNFAENKELVKKAKVFISTSFSGVRDRMELEKIWNKNDEMYRIAPDSTRDEKHRANEGNGVYHNGINVLTAIGYRTFTENPNSYKYTTRGIIEDEAMQQTVAGNAKILTLLLKKAITENKFKKNLKKALYDIYKYGNCVCAVPWLKEKVKWPYKNKETKKLEYKETVKPSLPALESVPLRDVYLDENIDSIEQPAVFIRAPMTWNDLTDDDKLEMPDLADGKKLRDMFDKYKESTYSEFDQVKGDEFDNADRTFQDHQQQRSGFFKHWYVWINLPIQTEKKGEWDEEKKETLFRVRVLGDPDNCQILEMRQNMFPGGIPMLMGHQSEDDIGAYHMSLGEKVETYHDQICVAQNQLIDNRSKNTRRPVFYDPMRVSIDKYDFGHSNAVPVVGSGDVRTAIAEMQLIDMTATITNTIVYCETKEKEIMNTTDAVVGMAMGGRTSASEYMGAQVAATTPIFADLADIEEAIIVEYMRKFAMYVHAYMSIGEIVKLIGPEGKSFQFDVGDMYQIEARGVMETRDKTMRLQNLMQLFNMTQDPTKRDVIMLRIAENMELENPRELVPVPRSDQAIKAALWENNEILIYGQWDEPEPGELHNVHLPIHKQAEMRGVQEKNPNLTILRDHIAKTSMLQKQEQLSAGASSLPVFGRQAGSPPTPGQESGEQISGGLGNIQAGSQIPAQQPV